MRSSAKQVTAGRVARLKTMGSRLDRRARWALSSIALLILASVPFWSAAVHFVWTGSTVADSVRVPILVYHSVAPTRPGQSPVQRELDVDTAAFRQQMSHLVANRYTVIPLGTLIDALDGQRTLPARAVVITFDDGWRSQYDNALPVLQQLHLPATFFIISKQVGVGPMYMDVDQVKSLLRAGMTIGSHSRTHANLTRITDAQLRDEVLGSREELRRKLGVDADIIAYPYGAWNTRVATVVQAAGYRGARAFSGGPWNDAAHRYALRSVLVTDDMVAFARSLGETIVAMKSGSSATTDASVR